MNPTVAPTGPPATGARRAPVALLAILAVALAARLAFVLALEQKYYFADTAEYRAVALELLAGRVPGPETPRAPFYPAFMALGFRLGGVDNLTLLRLMQVVLGVGLIALGARVGARVGRRSTGVLVALVMACSPTLLFVSGLLYPTTLYALLLLALTAGALSLADRPRPGVAALVGVTLGLGMLTDEVMIAPGIAVVAWLLAQSRRGGHQLVAAAAVVALVAGAMNATYVRLHSAGRGGQAAFVDKAQWTLWFARTDSVMTRVHRIQWAPDTPFRALPARAFLAREWHYLRTRPLDYAHDYGYEFVHFFFPRLDRIQSTNEFTNERTRSLGAWNFSFVLVLAILGLFAGAAAWRHRALLALVILSTAAFYALFFSRTRYRIPVEPQFAVFAALGLERLFPRLAAWLDGGPRAGAPAPPPAPATEGGR